MKWLLPLLLVAPLCAQDPEPTPAVDSVTVTVAPASIALVDGMWQPADTRKITATVDIQVEAKWVSVKVREIDSRGYLKAELVPVLPLKCKSGRCYGLDAGPGTYLVEVSCFDPKTGPSELTKRITIEGKKPDPDEDEDEDEDEDPEPGELPFPADGLSVMVIREASQEGLLPEEQRGIFTSAKVKKWLNDNCADASDGNPFARVWDDDYTDAQIANAPKEVQEAYKLVKTNAKSLPWVAISDGKKGFAGPLPGSVGDMIKLLEGFK